MHQTSSKHTFTSRHGRISKRSTNEKDRQELGTQQHKQGGEKRTRSRLDSGATACKRGRRVKRVNMQRLAHPRRRDSVTRQEIQEIKPQISRIRAVRRGSRAAEEEMLAAALAAFHQGVPPSSIWWCSGDANLAVRTRTEHMQRQGVPKHRVTERKVAGEDTKKGVDKRSRDAREGLSHADGRGQRRCPKRGRGRGPAPKRPMPVITGTS
jgi:hypothetical protein